MVGGLSHTLPLVGFSANAATSHFNNCVNTSLFAGDDGAFPYTQVCRKIKPSLLSLVTTCLSLIIKVNYIVFATKKIISYFFQESNLWAGLIWHVSSKRTQA